MDTLPSALAILETLIAFDTTSRGSNLAMIGWIEAFLRARAVPFWRVTSPDGRKANLLARLGPDGPGGVMLAGHTDVVPVDGQAWTSDPWALTERNGRLYGRGTADMKTFLALALAQVDSPGVAALQRPILLAMTYDEEVGCLGAPSLLAVMADLVTLPALAVVGEPTSMKVVSAHKGMRTFSVTVTGREAHSSARHQGVSAITEAAKLMALIGRMHEEGAEVDASEDLFGGSGVTTTVGTVHGGTANNILARCCAFSFDLRAPTESLADAYQARFVCAAEALDTEIKARAPEGGVEFARLASAPPLVQDRNSGAEAFVCGLTGDNGSAGANFVAEAGLYQQHGIPAVLCGPGSIDQAHQPDEWISLDQVRLGAAFLDRLIEQLTKP